MVLFLVLFVLNSYNFELWGYRWKTFENSDARSKNRFTSQMLEKKGDILIFRASVESTDTGLVYLSSGIISEKPFFYGTFVFTVEGDLSDLKDACFAPFLYDFQAGTFEVDIEFSKWGNPFYPSGNYGIIRQFGNWQKPDSVKRVVERFPIKLRKKSITKHYIYWSPDSLVFKSCEVMVDKEKPIKKWVVTDKIFIPNRPIYAEIYLWWPKRPKNLVQHEIKVIDFKYIPLKGASDKGLFPGPSKIPQVSH